MSENRIKSPKSNRKISDTLSPKVKTKMKQTNGESKGQLISEFQKDRLKFSKNPTQKFDEFLP